MKKSPANKIVSLIRPTPLVRISLLMGLTLITLCAGDSISQTPPQQTRDQCYECCKNSGHDDYYLEQCRLKCFRNNDHCTGAKGPKTETAAPPKPDPPATRVRVPQDYDQQVEQPAPPPQRQVQRPQLVWPNPLNLAPGREGEAAAHILAINGIPPQHPNYAQAHRAMQDVLLNFARNNPGGGSLPTSQLERIITQLR